MTTIIIADDHPLLLNGNKVFLEQKGFKVIGEANNGNDAYNLIIDKTPDLALLDFDMPILNGLEVAKALKRESISTKVIILTLYQEEAILNEIGNSIDGYIVKEAALEELEICIDKILKGATYISPLLRNNIYLDASQKSNLIEKLTATERKILKYIAKHLTTNEIAESLFVSPRTVEKHRSNIIQKLELDSKSNALIIWLQNHPELFDNKNF